MVVPSPIDIASTQHVVCHTLLNILIIFALQKCLNFKMLNMQMKKTLLTYISKLRNLEGPF